MIGWKILSNEYSVYNRACNELYGKGQIVEAQKIISVKLSIIVKDWKKTVKLFEGICVILVVSKG